MNSGMNTPHRATTAKVDLPYDEHPEYDQHEHVVIHDTPELRAIIAIHNSSLGVATGGCRIFPYQSMDEALTDVLRLSRGMTYKSAMAEINFGGGKSVIIADPAREKTENMLLTMGEFIDSLQGRYVAAEDSGTTVADIAVMARQTSHVSGILSKEQHQGDPSPRTALGVFLGIEEAVRTRFGSSLSGVTVGIQGAGNVGLHLARLLKQAGAKVLIADIDLQRVDSAVESLGVRSCSVGEILSARMEVLAPCALGAVINPETVDSIRAQIVAGAANNQLATDEMGEVLHERDILYAPDYVINAGGIIDIYYQRLGVRDSKKIESHLGIIPNNLAKIFAESVMQGRSTNCIADELTRKKFLKSRC